MNQSALAHFSLSYRPLASPPFVLILRKSAAWRQRPAHPLGVLSKGRWVPESRARRTSSEELAPLCCFKSVLCERSSNTFAQKAQVRREIKRRKIKMGGNDVWYVLPCVSDAKYLGNLAHKYFNSCLQMKDQATHSV